MIGITELLLVLAFLLLVVGTSKLPKLGRALGNTRRDFEAGRSQRDSAA